MNFFGDSKPISIFEIGSKMTELEMVMLAKKSLNQNYALMVLF